MVEGPVSGRRIKRRTVQYAVTGVVTVILIVAAVIISSSYYKKASEETRQNQLAELNKVADTIAIKLADSLSPAFEQLEQLEQKRLIDLLVAGDKTAIDAETELLLKKFQAGLKLRLFKPGNYDLDRDAKPPLGFASLAMLRDMEKSTDNTATELHLAHSPDAHIVIVSKLIDADKNLVGLIHLSLDPASVLKIIEEQELSGQYVELSQTVGGKSLTLVKKGISNLRSGKHVEANVKGTAWEIRVWGGDSNVSSATIDDDEDTAGSPLINNEVIIVVLAIFVLGTGGFLFTRRKKHDDNVSTGDIVYGGAVLAIMEGAHPGVEKLVPDLPDLGQNKIIQPLSQGLIDDDVTVIEKPPAAIPVKDKNPQVTTPVEKIPNQAVPVEADSQKPVAENVSSEATTVEVEPSTPPSEDKSDLAPEVFRAYDIRGVVDKTLSASGVQEIGMAIGSEAGARDQQTVIVGRDGRTSSPKFAESLIKGLRASGRDVIDIGMVPTPLLYFATHHLEKASGVMVTGSHNGPEYNGLKIILAGEKLTSDEIQALHTRIIGEDYTSGQGDMQTVEVSADYIRRVSEDIPVALGGAFKIVIDCGNGVAGALAPQVFKAMGHDIIELFCEVDGKFPNHQPDPSQPENLEALIAKVKEEQADLGLAFDGDGDRLGVVDGDGNIIWPDRQMMLFAKDVLSRNQGKPVIFDVKCSRHLKQVIEECGGTPMMWKTGHSFITEKMKEVDAPLAGELSGHIFFKERWYGFDDAVYAGARLIEILTNSKKKPAEVFAELPDDISTPEIRIGLKEKHHAQFMKKLQKKLDFDDAEITDIDGVRVDFPYGWGLIRPSNTTPCLIVRFEAEDEEVLHMIQSKFHDLIHSVAPDLKLPF